MKNYICFLLVSIFVAGCGGGEKDQLTQAVISYNAALSESYGSGDLGRVIPLTTPEQAALLDDRFRDFAGNGIRLSATLRSIHFSEIKEISAGEMEVVTDESWDFTYVTLQTGETISALSPQYRGRYALARVEGKWLVARVDVEPMEISEEKSASSAPGPLAGKPPAGSGLSPEEQVKNTVLTYLTLLADGYRNQNMTPLLHSATRKRADKAYYHMSSLGESEVKMNPRLLEIRIPSVILGAGERAEARAVEKWQYVYYRTDTGNKVYENDVSYELTYKLVREQGRRWLVDEITVGKTEEGKGVGELRFYERPGDHPLGEPIKGME